MDLVNVEVVYSGFRSVNTQRAVVLQQCRYDVAQIGIEVVTDQIHIAIPIFHIYHHQIDDRPTKYQKTADDSPLQMKNASHHIVIDQ
ncbi:MAG: hypothetical protein IKN55_06080 [Oscillospiraceae bacterium]|nr:hypothetical protein [Oscillospiraceae bacterium]